jgi:hypothetical protein
VRTLGHEVTVSASLRARAADQITSLESQIQTVAGLDLAALRMSWRRTFGRAAPAGLGHEFMARALAYHIQADAMGDLDDKASRTLEQLAAGDTSAVTRDRALGRRLHPGTELVREYQGQHYRVAVVRDGFSWNGTTYSTLSGVARAITGSNWNGYAFFGLRERRHG